MKELIEALQILQKYGEGSRHPTHCEHDVLMVCDGIKPEDVSKEDMEKLDNLGFVWSEYEDCFISYRFGS